MRYLWSLHLCGRTRCFVGVNCVCSSDGARDSVFSCAFVWCGLIKSRGFVEFHRTQINQIIVVQSPCHDCRLHTLHYKVLMDAYNILDSLLISSFILAKNRAFLARHGVTHIINATSTLANSHQHDQILYLRVPLEDKIGFEFPLSYFDDACSFIGVNNCCRRQSYILENGLSKSGVILVHCARGYSCWQFHL